MQEKKIFVDNNDLQWEEVADGVRRKIMTYDDKLMLVRVEFKKGGIGIIHQHYHTQITSVESGTFEVQINGHKQILKGGDAFYIPPNTDHGCVCIEEGVLLDIFSPMREDFVQNSAQLVSERNAGY